MRFLKLNRNAAGGAHTPTGEYFLTTVTSDPYWHWCSKCQALAIFTAGQLPVGVVLDGGVSRWLLTKAEGPFSLSGTLSFQVRALDDPGRSSWTRISAVYVRGAASPYTSVRELTIGLELGTAILAAWAVTRFGNHD